MIKYKCTSRFPVLILVDGLIQELTLGQEVESKLPLSHKFLQELTNKGKIVKLNTIVDRTPKRKKLNGDSE